MADQVNLIGGLTPGANQTLSSATVPQRPSSNPSPSAPPPTAEPAESARVREGAKASTEDLRKAADKVASSFNASQSNLRFMVDDTTGQYYFKVVDAATQKVIRQVPSEEVLAMARRLEQLSQGQDKAVTGLLVDAKG